MLRNLRSFVFATAITATFLVSSETKAQTNTPPPEHAAASIRPASTPGEHTWMKHLPTFQNSWELQRQTMVNHITKMTSNIGSVKSRQGIEAFIEEAMSLKSKAMWATDQDGHRRWLRDLFKKYVVPTAIIHQIVATECKAMDGELAACDNDMLIKLKADVPLDPASIKCRTISLELIDKQIDAIAGKIYAQVDGATYKSLAAFLAGTAGFEASRQVSRSFMKDDSGNVSLFGEIMSFGLGMLGDVVTSEITNEVFGTRSELRSSLNSLADQVIGSCCKPDGAVFQAILNECSSVIWEHRRTVATAVASELDIEADWGNATLQSAR